MTHSQRLVSCVVPARIGSTRYPQKPLALIKGIPLVVRTLERGREADCFQRLICATDSHEIAQVVQEAGFEVVMTPSEMRTGSDRVAWVADQMKLDFVLNLQGDEPLADLTLLRNLSCALVKQPDVWWTGASPLRLEDRDNSSVVKVLVNQNGDALDFTRGGTTFASEGETWLRHVGIYAYSRKQLYLFSSSPSSTAELEQSLEQFRLFPDTPIRVVVTERHSLSVDRPEDVGAVERYINLEQEYGHEF